MTSFTPTTAPARRRLDPLDLPPSRPPLRSVPDRSLSGLLGHRRRFRRRGRFSTAVASVVVCVGLFGIIALRVVLSEGQAEVDRLEGRVEAERAALRQIRLAVAELESPGRIAAEARSRLGMVAPKAIVTLAPISVANVASSREPPVRQDASLSPR